jgi:hypothetical protein
MRANYDILEFESNDQELIILDLGPWNKFSTVTNAAEQVVRELAPTLQGRRLLYYDSEGRLDEIVVINGEFAGFAPGPQPFVS